MNNPNLKDFNETEITRIKGSIITTTDYENNVTVFKYRLLKSSILFIHIWILIIVLISVFLYKRISNFTSIEEVILLILLFICVFTLIDTYVRYYKNYITCYFDHFIISYALFNHVKINYRDIYRVKIKNEIAHIYVGKNDKSDDFDGNKKCVLHYLRNLNLGKKYKHNKEKIFLLPLNHLTFEDQTKFIELLKLKLNV